MRIQTALRERNTRLLQVFASVRNFTFLSRVFRVDAKDVLPSTDTTTGRSLQKHSQDPGFQNIARANGPLPSIRIRPVSPGRRVQSFNLPPSDLLVKGWAAVTFPSFVRPALPATPSIYWTSGVWAREVFPNSFSLTDPPPFPATALQHITLSYPRQPRSEDLSKTLFAGFSRGAKYSAPSPGGQGLRSVSPRRAWPRRSSRPARACRLL